MSNDRDLVLLTQSPSAAGTNILNVNFDCLHAIFSSKCLTTLDLCSIGESHTYLKVVVDDVFAKNHKNYQFKLSEIDEREMTNTRRIFVNFGSLISKLSIRLHSRCCKESGTLLDSVSEYCSTLEALEFDEMKIAEVQAIKLSPLFGKLKKISLLGCQVYASQTLFANCESLVALKLKRVKFDDLHLALKSTFPKLDRFEYWAWTIDSIDDSMWNDFFARHKNLKTLNLFRYHGTSSLLPIVAGNCKQLVELEFLLSVERNEVNFEHHLSSILKLGYLKTLKIDCPDQNITKFLKRLEELKSLEFLILQFAKGDSEFIPALSTLTRLQYLDLWFCDGLTNLNPLSDLQQLTALKIFSRQDFDFDLVSMMIRLVNLKTLHLRTRSFEMNKQMYMRIVDVFRGRPARLQDPLRITCCTAKDFVADLEFDKILRITKL